MRKFFSIVAIVLLFDMAAPRAFAQSAHVAPQSAIDAALRQHIASTDADRTAVQRVLQRPEVKSVARRAGIDLRTVADAVATLGGQDLAAVAAQARTVDQSLAGGASTIVISTTTVIIGLLILILIIVAT